MRRKWIRRILFGLTGVTLLAVVAVFGEWKLTRSRGQLALTVAVAELDAREPGWRFRDLNEARNAGLSPPGHNSVARVTEAKKLVPPSFNEWAAKQNLTFGPVTNQLPAAEELAAAAKERAACIEAIRVARTVRDLPEGGFAVQIKEPDPLDTPLPHHDKLRPVGSLLSLDAIVLASEGHPVEALHSCDAILNVARGIGDEPLLISQLCRISLTEIAIGNVERTLAWNEVPSGLAETQARLAAELGVPRLTFGYRGERGMWFHVYKNLDSGELALKRLGGYYGRLGMRDRASQWYASKLFPMAQARSVEVLDEIIAASRMPDPERAAASEAITARIRESTRGADRLMAMFLPAIGKMNQAESRLRARLGCAVAGIACERYRMKNGRWPHTLAEIPRDILAAIPTDPYTGSPLGYLVEEVGVTVFSAGPAASGEGVFASVLTADSRHYQFRLWNPDLRRAAPEPELETLPE